MESTKDGTSVQVQSKQEEKYWTDDDEKRVRRKMDLRIMPMVFLLYLITFIDRSNVGNARILGMAKDLHLMGNRFSLGMTVFYLAYGAVSIPSNVGLRIVGGRLWMSTLIIGFGLVTLCAAFLKSYAGFMVLRFFLGFAEGGALPGFAFYLSLFYRRHELAYRVALFMVGASLAGAFGGLLAAGLSQIPAWGASTMIIDEWRNIFLFEGLISILLGIAAIFMLPSRPNKFKALSKHNQAIASQRIEIENREQSHEKINRRHIIRGVSCINSNICGVGLCCASLSVVSLSIFTPTLLHDFGWSPVKANLMSVPPYAVAAVFTVAVCFFSDRSKLRGPFIVFGGLVSATGFAILISPVSTTVRYIGVFFACCGCFAMGPLYISWILNNTGGPTVRAVAVAYLNTWAQFGILIGLWSYLPQEAPRYIRGNALNLGVNLFNSLIAAVGMLYCCWENSMRDRGARNHRLEGISPDEEWRLGYRNPRMRYVL